MNDIVVVWLFYPFYTDKAQEVWISHYYENLNWAWERTINEYIQYLQDLSDHYHDNIPISQESFITLLVEIIKEYISNNSLSTTSHEEDYKQMIYEKIYS